MLTALRWISPTKPVDPCRNDRVSSVSEAASSRPTTARLRMIRFLLSSMLWRVGEPIVADEPLRPLRRRLEMRALDTGGDQDQHRQGDRKPVEHEDVVVVAAQVAEKRPDRDQADDHRRQRSDDERPGRPRREAAVEVFDALKMTAPATTGA